MEITSQEYVLGFNHGYILTKYASYIVDGITTRIIPNNDYLKGFFAGQKEWELERPKVKLDDLKKIQNTFRDHEQDLEQ